MERSTIKLKTKSNADYIDGLIGLNPSVSYLCKLGKLMKNSQVRIVELRPSKYVKCKEVTLTGCESVKVYKSDIQEYVEQYCMSEVTNYQDTHEGDLSENDALEMLVDEYFDDNMILIEYVKFKQTKP